MPFLAIIGWYPVAVALSGIFVASSMVAEVVADTRLQLALDPAAFKTAYGCVMPADVAGIVAGRVGTRAGRSSRTQRRRRHHRHRCLVYTALLMAPAGEFLLPRTVPGA